MKDFFVLDGAEDTKYKKVSYIYNVIPVFIGLLVFVQIVQIVEGSNELFKAHVSSRFFLVFLLLYQRFFRSASSIGLKTKRRRWTWTAPMWK